MHSRRLCEFRSRHHRCYDMAKADLASVVLVQLSTTFVLAPFQAPSRHERHQSMCRAEARVL